MPPKKRSAAKGPKSCSGVFKDMEYTEALGDELENLEYYHAVLLDEDVKGMLKNNGDFLLRGDGGQEKKIILSFQFNGEMTNMPMKVQMDGNTSYTFDGATKRDDPLDLMRSHQSSIPLRQTAPDGQPAQAPLLNPVARQSWQFRKEAIKLQKKLGQGAFGEVFSGKLKIKKKEINVAVKVMKDNQDNLKATQELMKEANVMRQYKHKNIVRFYGIAMDRQSPMVVIELVNGGGLDSYLKANPMCEMKERGSFVYDLASGLSYLHTKKCIHRDIACRNALVDNTKKQAKIADFGLSRQAEMIPIQMGDKLPIRWMSPEVMTLHYYTQKADIYAFGITIYEIYTNAKTPFEEFSNQQVKDNVKDISFRPIFPSGTPPDIIEVAAECWKVNPDERISMSDVVTKLKRYIQVGVAAYDEAEKEEDPSSKQAQASSKQAKVQGGGKKDQKVKNSKERRNSKEHQKVGPKMSVKRRESKKRGPKHGKGGQ